MGTCPKCAHKVEHDFGIVSCNNCGAILSIDFDGNVSLSEGDGPELEIDPSPEPENIEVVEFAPIEESPLIVEAPSEEAEVLHEMTDVLRQVADSADAAFEVPESDFQENWIESAAAPDLSVPPPLSHVGEPPATVDFSDVVAYANAAELDNSPLVYAFRIEGIDSKDIRKKVLDVLSDIRLNIHIKDLIPTIKGGILELHDLSPIRASLIASRLREESVTFRWRQSVFQSQIEMSSSEPQT